MIFVVSRFLSCFFRKGFRVFASGAQSEYMASKRPFAAAVAMRTLGGGVHQFKAVNPVSEDSRRPVLRSAGVRDYSMLRPSQVARHVPAAANEREAMDERGVQFVHGSSHRELGVPRAHRGLRGRDVDMAFGAVKER